MNNEEKVDQLIRQNNLRPTKTRQAVLSAFLSCPIPLSAPQIIGELERGRHRVNKTTVYRELEVLVKTGLVEAVSLQDRRQYYELAERAHHHHFVCLRCERIEDVDVNEQELLREEQKLSTEKRFAILRHSLEFFGLCKMCSEI